MHNLDLKFMRRALNCARQGVRFGQTPFGACIVKHNRMIAMGHNLVWQKKNIILHAEMVAIGRACRVLKSIDLSGCTIYSTCEPCPMCFAACHWARIKRIVFGASIRDAQNYGFNEMTLSNAKLKKIIKSKIGLTSGVGMNESRALFKFWQAQGAARVY